MEFFRVKCIYMRDNWQFQLVLIIMSTCMDGAGNRRNNSFILLTHHFWIPETLFGKSMMIKYENILICLRNHQNQIRIIWLAKCTASNHDSKHFDYSINLAKLRKFSLHFKYLDHELSADEKRTVCMLWKIYEILK